MNKTIIIPPIDSNVSIQKYFKQYGEQLDSYICLSPFLKWPKNLVLDQFPDSNRELQPDPLLLDVSSRQIDLLMEKDYSLNKKNYLSWKELISVLGFRDVPYLYQVLRNMFFEDLSNKSFRNDCLKLKRYLEKENISFPGEGGFPDVFELLFVESFKLFNYTNLFVSDCFGDKLVNLSIDDLLIEPNIEKNMRLPYMAFSYFTEDLSMSYTGPMDCYFSILTASKDRIEKILEKYNFEGFYADESTTCEWGLGD